MESQFASLSRVSLSELQERATLEVRHDRKYVLSAGDLAPILAALGTHYGALEIDDRRAFSYETLYFDTPDLRSYRDHAQGRRRRYKTRLRRYSRGLSFFEVKTKGARGRTVKRRLPSDAAPLMLTASGERFFRSVIQEEYGMSVESRMAPILTVRNRRATLISHDAAERVTLDWDVSFESTSGRRGALRAPLAIVETKSAQGRSRADRLLHRAGHRPIGLSKYCAAAAVTHDISAAPFQPAVRRFFTGQAAEAPGHLAG